MTKVIYTEPTGTSFPVTVTDTNAGGLAFSAETSNVHIIHRDNVAAFTAALVEHLGLHVVQAREKLIYDKFRAADHVVIDGVTVKDNLTLRQVRDDPAPTVTPESIGVVDGKAPKIDREPLRFWLGGTESVLSEKEATRGELAALLHKASDGKDLGYALYKLANAIESGAL